MIERRKLLPLLAVFAAFSILGSYLIISNLHVSPVQSIPWLSSKVDASPVAPIPKSEHDPHPIIHMLYKADSEFHQLLRKETHDLASSARAYRARRGRHPPPGFEQWHQYALDNKAFIIEEFWDQIYHDLKPLWALNRTLMHAAIRNQNKIIHVRNGKVTCNSDHFWAEIWKDLVGSVSKNLPDLDMAVNIMDEPRLFIPWEDMRAYVLEEQGERTTLAPGTLTSEYSGMYMAVSYSKPWKLTTCRRSGARCH